MNYRDDRERCPTCGSPAIWYIALWHMLRCVHRHDWEPREPHSRMLRHG